MAYGDLQTFLPRAEGEVLDVERAKSEGASKAAYLSSMDQFYEQLKESSRQFNLQQALAEKQFTWQSGFEERKLASETKIAEEKMGLEKYLGELQGKYWESQTEIAKAEVGIREKELALKSSEQTFLQSYYTSQLEQEKARFGMESQVMLKELYPEKLQYKPYSYGTGAKPYDINARAREQFAKLNNIPLIDYRT